MPERDGEDGSSDLPLDENFVEQAEDIPEKTFLELTTDHPAEESIIRSLTVGGAKVLVDPRGCGKTTLLLKAYYQLLRDRRSKTFPVYVNFKLSLKLEPLYARTPNAAFWFRMWLNLKVYQGIHTSVERGRRNLPVASPSIRDISAMIDAIESGKGKVLSQSRFASTETLVAIIRSLLNANGMARCVLLLDDAAHAFSPKQQEDFFEFFRQIKSNEISPKAAIYPGITTHSPTFHVGHDAQQIDAWIRPDKPGYRQFMRRLAERRFRGNLPDRLKNIPGGLDLLAFAAFGIPRSFLNMLRTVYYEDTSSSGRPIDRRGVLDIAKQGRELSHNVYESLVYKLPAYKTFVLTGQDIYQNLISSVKRFNRDRPEDDQALKVGIKRPIPPEIDKVIGFLQYAGLLMHVGENSRGVKGAFELYMVHFGDLVTENAIIGQRTKTISLFVKAFVAQTHQAWPRISPESLAKPESFSSLFRLSLPHCQNCGAERVNEHAKFCQNCGSQLKSTSLYDELVNQDISTLPLSARMVNRIKQNSNIRKIKDILIDSDRRNLRAIKHIGPIRARRIASCAEEHVA